MSIPTTENALRDFILDLIRNEPVTLTSYTIENLPTAMNNAGTLIRVPDSAAGNSQCMSDGEGTWIDVNTGSEVV